MARHVGPRPPRDGAWEYPNLRPENSRDWLIEGKRPPTRSTISSRLWGSLLKARIVRLARSTLREYEENAEWQVSRYLGSGTFGAAAVFTKSDGNKILDEIVVKEVTVVPRWGIRKRNLPGSNNRYFTEEALIHSAVSSRLCDSRWNYRIR